jgi:hypothetical protein
MYKMSQALDSLGQPKCAGREEKIAC